jgi:hypothetical protein
MLNKIRRLFCYLDLHKYVHIPHTNYFICLFCNDEIDFNEYKDRFKII